MKAGREGGVEFIRVVIYDVEGRWAFVYEWG